MTTLFHSPECFVTDRQKSQLGLMGVMIVALPRGHASSNAFLAIVALEGADKREIRACEGTGGAHYQETRRAPSGGNFRPRSYENAAAPSFGRLTAAKKSTRSAGLDDHLPPESIITFDWNAHVVADKAEDGMHAIGQIAVPAIRDRL